MARMLSVFFTRRPRFSHLNKKTTVYIDGVFFVSDTDNFAKSFNLQQGGKVRTSGEHQYVTRAAERSQRRYGRKDDAKLRALKDLTRQLAIHRDQAGHNR